VAGLKCCNHFSQTLDTVHDHKVKPTAVSPDGSLARVLTLKCF
jgi:hypothetical protein